MIIIILLYIFAFFRFFLVYLVVLISNLKIHNLSIKGIVNTFSVFFDKNPTGRILNRFSKDVLITDEPILHFINESVHLSLTVLGALILIVAISPATILAFLILLVLVIIVMKIIVPFSN